MLTETTVARLSALTYRAEAKRGVCLIPLGGICWDDELPHFRQLVHIPEEDRDQMFRLFSIRTKIWKGLELSEGEQNFWDEARARMPGWALFQRITICDADLEAQEEAERETAKAFLEVFGQADRITVTEKDGMRTVAATFDLLKEDTSMPKRQPWWKRAFRLK